MYKRDIPTLGEIQEAFNAGSSAEKTAFQSSVSGDVARTATVIIPGGRVSDAVTIPVMIDGTQMPSAWWAYCAADGANLRAYSSGGGALPIDVLMCDVASRRMHVMILTPIDPSTGAVLRLVATTANAAIPATHPAGRNAVWAGYAMVYGGSSYADRCGVASDLTVTNGMDWGVVGRVNGFGATHQGIAYDARNECYHAVDSLIVRKCDLSGTATGQTVAIESFGVATQNHIGQGVCVDGGAVPARRAVHRSQHLEPATDRGG